MSDFLLGVAVGGFLTVLVFWLFSRNPPPDEPKEQIVQVWVGEPNHDKLLSWLSMPKLEKMCHELMYTKGEFRYAHYKNILGDTAARRVRGELLKAELLTAGTNRTVHLTRQGWQFVSNVLNPRHKLTNTNTR